MNKRNIVIILLFLGLSILTYNFFASDSGKSISPEEAKAKVTKLIAMNPDNPAVVQEVIDEGGLYRIVVSANGQSFDSYLSKDGEKFFPDMINLKEMEEAQANAPKPEVSVKSDKPMVELFVMSQCPYGTQIEKGILPVLNLLGDKIDFELKFVDYAIHDKVELDEQTQQYCIGKQGKDKLLSYLGCFLEDGNSSRCLTETEIDKVPLDKCIIDTNKEFKTLGNYADKSTWTQTNSPSPIFTIYQEDNTKYNIEGSPELVINEEKISAYRDPKNLLASICSAFNTQPEECNQELSSATPAPGFGMDTTSTPTDATCD